MKMAKRLLIAVLCAALAACMAACAHKTNAADEANDETKELEDVSDAGTQGETDPFWVLVVGNDTRTGTTEITKAEYADGNARSDVMMLVRVDPQNYKITIVSIPRDTEADVDGAKNKINYAYQIHGIQGAIDQTQLLTGVTPKYYLDMDFVQFEDFINQLGGITANVPIDMHLVDIVNGGNIQLYAGTQDLDGPQALVLARQRKQYADDLDACRQIQDRQIVRVGIQKVAADPVNAAAHAATLIGNCDTNWNLESLTETVADFCDHADQITYYSATGPYKGGIDAETGLWLAVRDEATWSQIIAAADAGEDPSGFVAEPQVLAAQ